MYRERTTAPVRGVILMGLLGFAPGVVCTGSAEPVPPSCQVLKDADGLRRTLPACWYNQAAAIKVVTFKKNLHYGHELSLNPETLATQLDEIKAQGFSAIEIFAPADGVTAYNGLDTKNHYRIDPELGTMDDFRRAVRLAHTKHLAVIVFINLGYFSIEAPDWIQAAKDKKSGITSERTKWFLWSDKPDTPTPHTQEDIYVKPVDRERDKAYWGWQYSEIAGCYYWARWKADGPDKKAIPLPQMNWGDAGWRSEAERIVRFWMDTGLDGMIIDAPLCYPNQTWAHNRQHITSIVASYGNTLIDPEGGRDEAWITESGYNMLHDYGVDYGAEIDSGDPSKIESELRRYHDRIVERGGVLYSGIWKNKHFAEPAKRHLQRALLAGAGSIVVYVKRYGSPDAEEARILHMKQLHPALYPTATRRKLTTDADDKYYAILKTAKDESERMVVVYNFQPTPATVQVNLGVLESPGIVDAQTGAVLPQTDQFHPVPVELPAYGYRFFTVIPEKR